MRYATRRADWRAWLIVSAIGIGLALLLFAGLAISDGAWSL